MASSSSQRPKWNYDVFLSFRGEDTRKTFTSHLYEGLTRMNIVTFQDDKRLEQGSSITKELCKAIEESKFAIVIFSKNYASSGWCLDELVMIMKCKDKYGLTVIPVFYDVDPATVRRQQGSFAKAFDEHKRKYKDDAGMLKVQGWRDALSAAADLTGHDIHNRIEAECIQKIVEEIFFEKCKSTHLSSLQDVVGISTHLEKLKSLLDVEANDIRIVGIWGMGGVGKTTIAQAIFSYLTHHFDATCFLANVRGDAEKYGMHSLQNTLLSDLLRKKSVYVNNKEAGKNMIASTCWKRVLIVLDDINHKDHMEYLAGDLGCFGKGSRVIVTTRNKHLIEKDNALYKVRTLPDHEAMQVFSRHAFKKEVPDQGFEEHSQKVVNHSKGLPLALKVLGGLLHNRDIDEWERFIKQMKKSVNSEIVEKLIISYDDLESIEQQMFLDIACFFRGEDKGFVMRILESCFGPNIGLSVLIERHLVVISEYNKIEMHDLIQDMGKDIVNVQKKPGKRSRLWLPKDIEEVMMNNTGTNTIEAIMMIPSKLQISKKALEHMDELRMLLLEDGSAKTEDGELLEDGSAKSEDDLTISFHDDTFKYLSNNLSCFVWKGYHGESFPPNFEPKGLVHLELTNSKVRHLWNGRMNLTYLRTLNLRRCGRLIETPDFRGMPNLEYLDLRDCEDLRDIHPSLGLYCTKLISLNLSGCWRLIETPEFRGMPNLEYLDLSYCSALEELHPSLGLYCTKLISLNLSWCRRLIETPDFRGMPNLEYLDLSCCRALEEVHPSLGLYCTKLIRLNLNGCRRLIETPNFRGTPNLEYLNLSCCRALEELHPSLGLYCTKLIRLNLSRCDRLIETPDFRGVPNLEYLDLKECWDLREVHPYLGICTKLIRLDLDDCYSLESFPCVNGESLKYLSLKSCSNLEKFPEIIGSMKSELEIYMDRCGIREVPSSIFQYPNPHITKLDLSGLRNIVILPNSICKLKSLVILNVSHCKKLESLPKDIGDLENLEELHAGYTRISRPPSSIVLLNKLKILSFEKSKLQGRFVVPRVNQGLRSLEELNLTYCNLIDGGLPEDIGCLSSLKRLLLLGNDFGHLPRSIAQLGALQVLRISNCETLGEGPESVLHVLSCYKHPKEKGKRKR